MSTDLDQQIALLVFALPPKRPASPTGIIKQVAALFCTSSTMILGRSQRRHDAYVRHLAMYMVREHTDLSYPEIGRVFGRDHSTVQSGVQRIQTLIDQSHAQTTAHVEALTRGVTQEAPPFSTSWKYAMRARDRVAASDQGWRVFCTLLQQTVQARLERPVSDPWQHAIPEDVCRAVVTTLRLPSDEEPDDD